MDVLKLELVSIPINDRYDNLQELPIAILRLQLVGALVVAVGYELTSDCLPDEHPCQHALAVDPVNDGLQVVPLARVWRVK